MKKILLVIFFLVVFAPGANAQVKSGSSTVQAKVGDFYLDVAGFVSPNASVLMYGQGQFMRSSVADTSGNFFISQILVREGFSEFCLEAIDFKRVGTSYTCFKIPPMTKTASKKDIFLPPTIGVSGRRMTPGSSIFSFGYTMPGASVRVHVGGGIFLDITADQTGYYKVELKDLPVGKYSLFATAIYNGKDSEKPSKTIEVESLSRVGEVKENVSSTLERFIRFILTSFITYAWIVLPIIILLIILISKRLRDKIKNGIWLSKKRKKKNSPKHHEWMFGY